MPRSKAQQLARLQGELQKSQRALAAKELPSFWTLVSWSCERDRRNEAIREEAIQRAIANISLGASCARPEVPPGERNLSESLRSNAVCSSSE